MYLGGGAKQFACSWTWTWTLDVWFVVTKRNDKSMTNHECDILEVEYECNTRANKSQ
jgi:hypothetical protein